MFNRRMLAAGAASAALAAAGVLGSAVSASAAAMPGPVGPVTTLPNQPSTGQQPQGTSRQQEKQSPVAQPAQSVIQRLMSALGEGPQPGQMRPAQAPAQP